MKAILTCFAIICLGSIVYASQPQIPHTELENISPIEKTDTTLKKRIPEKKMARLYLFKNSRIKKALAFRTKANKSKLA